MTCVCPHIIHETIVIIVASVRWGGLYVHIVMYCDMTHSIVRPLWYKPITTHLTCIEFLTCIRIHTWGLRWHEHHPFRFPCHMRRSCTTILDIITSEHVRPLTTRATTLRYDSPCLITITMGEPRMQPIVI